MFAKIRPIKESLELLLRLLQTLSKIPTCTPHTRLLITPSPPTLLPSKRDSHTVPLDVNWMTFHLQQLPDNGSTTSLVDVRANAHHFNEIIWIRFCKSTVVV